MSEQKVIQSFEHGRIPSSELFQTDEAVVQAAEGLLDDGVIQVEVSEAEGLYLSTPVDESKIRLLADEKYIPYRLTSDDLERRLEPSDIAEVHTREAETVKQEVTRIVANDAWWLQEPKISEDVENGNVSQLEAIHIGEITIPLVNFTDKPIDSDKIEAFTRAIQRCGEATDGAAQRMVKAICIQDRSRFRGEGTMASTRVASGVIRLSEKMFTGEFDEEIEIQKTGHSELPIDYQTVSLVHEIGHLVQGNSQAESYGTKAVKYKDATGWTERSYDVSDDYGTLQNINLAKRGMPGFKAMQQKGEGYEEVSAREIMKLEEMLDAKPVTGYGETNSREDFAEAFPVYVYKPDNLDKVRRGGN